MREEWLKDKVLEAYIEAVGSQKLLAHEKQRLEANADDIKAQLKKQRQSAQRLKDAKKALFEQFSLGIIEIAEYKAENTKLTLQLSDAEQEIVNLETAIELIKRKPLTQTTTSAAEILEFNDDMMACVKSIKVFGVGEAVVDIDLSDKELRS